MARARHEAETNETGEYDPLGPIDLDLAPTSFVADWSVATSIVKNITGEARRETVFLRVRSSGRGRRNVAPDGAARVRAVGGQVHARRWLRHTQGLL
jgi:hypothetical protein